MTEIRKRSSYRTMSRDMKRFKAEIDLKYRQINGVNFFKKGRGVRQLAWIGLYFLCYFFKNQHEKLLDDT